MNRVLNNALLLAAFLLAVPVAYAQQGVRAAAGDPDDAGLVSSVNRTLESPFDIDRAVEVITVQEIWRRNARTLPEVLMEEAGVFVQQTSYGSGSPIIRGLVGKQILIMIDGVRVNNATYRFGPVQYLATIDLAAVERIEIVRGVVSVLDDALGGSINIITRKGPRDEEVDSTSARLFTRYSSADRAFGQRAELYGGGEHHRYAGGVTFRDTHDVRVGGGSELGATGYRESAANASFERQLTGDRTLSLGYMLLQQEDVPRTDRVLDRTNVRFDYEPQRLQLARVTYDDQNFLGRDWSHGLRTTLYWNRQDEGNLEVRSNRPAVERRFDDSVNMIGASLELSSFLKGRHRFVYGADFSSEHIRSTRSDLNVTTGVTTPQRGKYTDDASFRSAAVYLQDRMTLGRRLTASIGGRYSRFHSAGKEVSPVGELDLDANTGHLSGAVSLSYRASPSVRFVGTVIDGFRPPNIDDLSIYEERAEGTEVPNPAIRPEIIRSGELGVRVSRARFSGSAFVFRSDLRDLLVRTTGTQDGLSYFDLNGNGQKDSGEAAVLQKQNIGTAKINGLELEWRFRPTATWTAYGNYTVTRGEDERLDVPLTRIPPNYGLAAIRWTPELPRAPWAEVVYLHASSQTRVSPADIADTRIGAKGTPGFDVVHLRAGMSILASTRLVLAWENITDQLYKYHGSGTSRPGSQVVIGLEWQPMLRGSGGRL